MSRRVLLLLGLLLLLLLLLLSVLLRLILRTATKGDLTRRQGKG